MVLNKTKTYTANVYHFFSLKDKMFCVSLVWLEKKKAVKLLPIKKIGK